METTDRVSDQIERWLRADGPKTLGSLYEGKVIIDKGVAAGETVVTDGQSRLFPGAKIATK